ncbi:MAG: hypothetical protein AAF405_04545 [Pseudomonadota bacterium]
MNRRQFLTLLAGAALAPFWVKDPYKRSRQTTNGWILKEEDI